MQVPGAKTIYTKLENHFNKKWVKHHLRHIYVVSEEKLDEMAQDYFIRIISNIMLVLIAALCIGVGLFVNGYRSEKQVVLNRDSYGGDESVMELETEIDGKKQTFEIDVLPLAYDAETIPAAFEKGFAYLDSVYLGNNESADYITENLNLVDAIDELGLTVSWDMENEDYVNYKGEIVNEKLETPVLQNLTATLSYEDFQASRQYPVKISGKEKSKTEQILDKIKMQIKNLQIEAKDSQTVHLPEEVDGYRLSRSERVNAPILVFILAGVVCVLLLYKGRSDLRRKEQKRNQELLNAYPAFTDMLSLYMGAGLTVKGALTRIVTMTNSRILSEELNYMLNEIQSGIPEMEGYYRLGNRLNLPVYRKMLSLLAQNVKKGTRDILNLLAEEELAALQMKRELARKKGEEAGTRLLFPMILQLGVVMIIVIAPALMGF